MAASTVVSSTNMPPFRSLCVALIVISGDSSLRMDWKAVCSTFAISFGVDSGVKSVFPGVGSKSTWRSLVAALISAAETGAGGKDDCLTAALYDLGTKGSPDVGGWTGVSVILVAMELSWDWTESNDGVRMSIMPLISLVPLHIASAASSALAVVDIKFAFSISMLSSFSFIDPSKREMVSSRRVVTEAAINFAFLSWSALKSKIAIARSISTLKTEIDGVWIVKSSRAVVSVSIVISAVGVNKKRFSSSARADSSSVT